MITILPDLFLLEGLRLSNVYLIVAEEGLTLVDAGTVGEVGKIDEKLIKGGYHLKDLRQVVITHAHFDHIGSAAQVVRQSGAKVIAHKDEAAIIEQRASIPYHSLAQRLLFGLEEHMMPRPPAVSVDILLEDGDLVAGTGGYTAVHTPGHTPGSLCLYHAERHILIVGDALFNKNPMTGKRGLIAPPALVSSDPVLARLSIRKLARLEVDVLLCGHGKPVVGNAGEMIRRLG